MLSRAMTRLLMIQIVLATIPVLSATGARAQSGSFNSGSTGADGAFSPATTQSVQVPESGVFNYTTYNIPAGVTITYLPNSKNTPVTILCSGNVTIVGTINVDGQAGTLSGIPGRGGPGGFRGGTAGFGFGDYAGTTGDGPGGGGGGTSASGSNPGGGGGGGFSSAGNNGSGQNPGQGGPKYGAKSLLPLIGGSGGGGGGISSTGTAGPGGGGGGAILIASSGTITFTSGAQILARGGAGAGSGSGNTGGGSGSGGAIRIVANTISGTCTLNASGSNGGNGSFPGGSGSIGYVRIEAYQYSSFSPSATGASSYGLPNPAVVSNSPSLKIASVAGIAAPAQPLGSLQGAPDIVVPTSQANPVTVSIEGTNVPTGTVVQVTLTPANGARTIVQSNPLSGTLASSTATASVSLPAGQCLLTATATIDLIAMGMPPMFIDGERVRRMEVIASYGKPSEVFYITESGRRVLQ